eukprot:8118641-Pyramimonas_sp.AAC.1
MRREVLEPASAMPAQCQRSANGLPSQCQCDAKPLPNQCRWRDSRRSTDCTRNRYVENVITNPSSKDFDRNTPVEG